MRLVLPGWGSSGGMPPVSTGRDLAVWGWDRESEGSKRVPRDDARGLPVDPDVEPGAHDDDPPDSPDQGARGNRRVGRPRRRRELAVLASVAAGGVVGGVARAGVLLAFPTPSRGFPWSTLAVNVSGSLLLGFLLVVLLERFGGRRLARAALGTGVIGAYTTFSTFMVESLQLIRGGALGTALAYLTLSLAAGLGATVLGVVGARGVLGLAREGGRG